MKLAAFNRQQDDLHVPTSEEQLLFQNLCILGLAGGGSKNAFASEFSRSSFRKCNTKALEYCLFHLHGVLKGRSRSQKEFKGIWPLIDKPQQAAFYQKVIEWLKELKDAGKIEHASNTQMSVLRTASGHRIVALLLDLSAAAMHAELERLRPQGTDSWGTQASQLQESKLTDEVGSAILVIAQAKVKLLCTKFLQANHDAAAAQAQQEAFAKDLVSDYQQLRSQDQRIRHELGDDTLLLDQLARAPWRLPEHDPPPTSGSSKAQSGPHSNTANSHRADQIELNQNHRFLPPFLAPPVLLQPDSVEDALRVLCGSPDVAAPHNPLHASIATAAVTQTLPVFVTRLAQLQEHLQDHGSLQGLLCSSTSAAAHPHAIDGAKLAAALSDGAASDGESRGQRAPTTHSHSAGGSSTAWPAHHLQQDRHRGTGAEAPVPVHPEAILSGFAVMVRRVVEGITKLSSTSQEQRSQTPGAAALIASPSISTSHAAHLAVRVRMHTASVGRLLELRAELKTRLSTAETVLGGWSTTVHNKMAQVNNQFEEAGPAPEAALSRHPSTPPTAPANSLPRQLATPLYMGMGSRSAFTSMQSSPPPPLQQQPLPRQSPPSYPLPAQGYSSSRSSGSSVPHLLASPTSSSSQGAFTQRHEGRVPGSDSSIPAGGSSPGAHPHQHSQFPLHQRSAAQGLGGISPWAPNVLAAAPHPATFTSSSLPQVRSQEQPAAVAENGAFSQTAPQSLQQPQPPSKGEPYPVAHPGTGPCDAMDVDSDPDLDLIAQEAAAINWQEFGSAQKGHIELSPAWAAGSRDGAAVPFNVTTELQPLPVPVFPSVSQHHVGPVVDTGSQSSSGSAFAATGSGPRRLNFGGASETCLAGVDTSQGASTPDSSMVPSASSLGHSQQGGFDHGSYLSPPTSVAATPAAVTMSTLLQRYNRVSKY